jgi:hypothetical protein
MKAGEKILVVGGQSTLPVDQDEGFFTPWFFFLGITYVTRLNQYLSPHLPAFR